MDYKELQDRMRLVLTHIEDINNITDLDKQDISIFVMTFMEADTKERFDKSMMDFIEQHDDNPQMMRDIVGGNLLGEMLEYYDSL